VVRVDPATGAVTPGFPVSESALLTGLADAGDTLLVAEIAPDRVHRFTLEGRLLGTVLLPGGLLITGVDTDATLLYVTSHNTGHVHVFTMDGTPAGVVEMGQTGDLTGVTLDADGESLWAATGTGLNDLLHVDFAGNVLGGFPGDVPGVMGLHAVSSPLFADGFESGDLAAWSETRP
jgi:sugar lactone lactonase YvrE